MAVHIAEVNLYARQFTLEPSQNPLCFAPNESDQSGVDGNVFVAVDLDFQTAS
jgi:hypothetical protein